MAVLRHEVDGGAPVAVRRGPDPLRPARYRLLRRVLGAGLLIAFGFVVVRLGLPTDRPTLLAWVLAALAVTCVGRGWSALARLLADWVPLGVLLLLYDRTRGLADHLGVPVHVTQPLAVDRLLGGGTVPTVWLQAHWEAPWWHVVATLVYSSHFVVTPVVLAVLWVRDRGRWARYARLVLGLSAAGLVTYVLYPAAPPWLAARMGELPPVHRLSGAGWEVLGLPRAGALMTNGQAQVNQVAAVPSLHTAFAVLTCLVLLPVSRHVWQRVGLISYAVLMPVVLVWSGEHYVVDTLLGAGYAFGVCAAGELLARGWHRRRTPAVGTASVTATTSSG